MGRDILRKLGITLTASKNTGKKVLQISDTSIKSKIIKWILKKYPKLCTRLEKSKNHIAKPTKKENFKPVQQKGRRVPLYLLDKVEAELEKINAGQTINQTRQMLGRTFHKSGSNNSKTQQKRKNCIRLKETQ